MKLYCEIAPGASPTEGRGLERLQRIRARSDHFAVRVYNDLLSIIGLKLEAAALQLPDIVDVDRKLDFQNRTLPALRAALAGRRFSSLQDGLLPWLRNESAAMTPGADPLPALRGAIGVAVSEWGGALADDPVVRALREWTGEG